VGGVCKGVRGPRREGNYEYREYIGKYDHLIPTLAKPLPFWKPFNFIVVLRFKIAIHAFCVFR